LCSQRRRGTDEEKKRKNRRIKEDRMKKINGRIKKEERKNLIHEEINCKAQTQCYSSTVNQGNVYNVSSKTQK
jgi:hypothetical protein